MSWLNDNRFKIGLVGSVLGIAYLGGRYFDYMDEQQAKSYGAEKIKRRKVDAQTRKTVGRVIADNIEFVFYDIADSAFNPKYNNRPITQKGWMDFIRESCNDEWPMGEDLNYMRWTVKDEGYDADNWSDAELVQALWPECKRQIIARAKRDAPEIVAWAKEKYGNEYDAETFHAEKKSLSRNTIKAKGRNSYDRFKHIMEMKVKMLSPHFKKKYAKENRLPSFTSGGTTRYWQAFVDGWREMEKAKVKDMGDVIGLGFKPENAFSVNEYWGRIDGAEAYMDWSAGRKDTSGYYSKAYFIPTEEYDVPSMRAEKKNCGCGKNPCVTYGAEKLDQLEDEELDDIFTDVALDSVFDAEHFNAMSFKQWSDDEMHEPKHGGSHMQFDDWLDDEIKSHGDIPLSKWGYEEEHDEKEHQHSESFNANQRKYQAVDVPLGMVCVLCEKDKPATHRIVENGMPFFLCEKHWFNYTMGASNIHADLGAETFEAKVGTAGTRVWVEPEGCFVDTYKHGIVVQEHPRHSKVYQNGKLLKTYRGDGHYISATSYARELEWNYKPKTAFAETFNAESMADRFAKRFPDHKILRDRKGMMAKFRKSQLDDRNWVGWVQLTGYGKQPCILASDLKVGDHIVYNTGASAEVVEIKPKGKATLTVSAISDHDGNTYDRDYRKTAWIPILMSWNIERRANRVKKNAKMMDAESFNAEIDSKYDDVINQLVQSDLVQGEHAVDDVTAEYLKEELIENIESGLIVPVGRLKQRLKSAGFKHKNTDPDKYGYGTFHTYEPMKLGNERLTMQLVEGISTQRNEFIPAGYGLLGAYLDDGEKLERVVILKEMEEIEPLMRKIGLLKEGDRIIRNTEYADSLDYCEFKFPSLAGLVNEELGIDMIEWDEENGDLLLTLELNDGLNRRQAHISTPLKREDFDNYRAESFNVESFAAYASADLTKRIREDLKKAFPNLKFSVKKSSGSLGVDVTLMKGDIDFSDLFDDIPHHKRHWERWNDPKPEWTGERSLNQYHFDSYNPKYTELFEKILRIIRGEDWFDHSDAQTDYFHTAYYISMAIGKWNKPYVYDPKLKKGTKPTLESLGGKGMGDAYSQIDFDAESFNAPIVNERYSPQGWSLYGRKLYYQGRQQGSIIGNTSGGFKNEPTSTYAGRQYVRWTPTAMRMAEKAVFDEVSQEHEPQSFEDWMDVIYETNERLNPTSYAFGAETFEAVAVKPKGLEANTPVEKVMLNEYLMNQVAREEMRQAIVSDLTMNIGGYKGMRSKILKKQQPKMLTEEYDKRLREEFED